MGTAGTHQVDNPLCYHCQGYTRIRGYESKRGRWRYMCVDCGRRSSARTADVATTPAIRELQARLQKARMVALTLGEFFAIAEGKDPRNQDVLLAHYLRRSEYARRRGVSRQRVHQWITEGRLRRVQVGGLTWVREG